MTCPSSRHNAGKIEIENKQRALRDELKEREERIKEKEISKEEHEARLKVLRDAGLLI